MQQWLLSICKNFTDNCDGIKSVHNLAQSRDRKSTVDNPS